MDTRHTASSSLGTAIRWIAVVITLGIVVMAVLIGQGVWGGERNLIPGHGHLGNTMLGLAVVQFVLTVVMYQRKQGSAPLMVATFVLVVLLFSQIGLGYSGRSNTSLIAWHVPLGVTVMALSSFTTALAWLRPATAAPVQEQRSPAD